jgi:outer membrane receptor for ferrienterochelin and colicins
MYRIYILTVFLLCGLNVLGQEKDGLSGMSLEDLMNIKVVSSVGVEQTAGEAPSTIRVITSQQIEERGYEKLGDVLRDMEGVDIIHVSGYFPNIFYFRGMYGAENLRTLLLVDGIRENNLVGSGELGGPAYSMHNVERIEIIWGPASALYGADAFGGVINIIHKKGAEMGGLHYEKGFGTYNTSFENVAFGMRKKDLDISLSGSLYSTDGPRYRNRDPFYHGSFIDNAWSINGNISYTYKKYKFTLGSRVYDTPMSWGLMLNSATKILNLPNQGNGSSNGAIGTIYRDVINDLPNLNEVFARTGFVQVDYKASDKLLIAGEIIYRETGTSNNSFVYLSIDTNLGPTIDTAHVYRLPIFNISNRIRYDLSGNYSIGKNQNIYAGVQFIQDNLERGNRQSILDTNKYEIDGIPFHNLNPTFRPRRYYIRDAFGSYVQYMLRTSLLNKTSFTAGLRYDVNSDYESPISPRLGIVINPEKTITMKLLFGTAFRTPTPTEISAAVTTFGTKALKPEQVSTYEMNLIYQPAAKWLLQLNGFHNDLSNIFVLNSLTGGNFNQKQTQGRAEISGLEFRADMVFTPQLSSFVNYTYQHGRQEDTKTHETFDIPNLPEMKANAGITYNVADYLIVTGIVNWIGERNLPHTNPYGIGRGYVMDGYFLGNLVLTTKKFYQNRVSASVNIQNVFNEGYFDPGVRTADGILYSTVLEQPGRTLLLKITVNL